MLRGASPGLQVGGFAQVTSLAHRADFRLGDSVVRPSTRTVEGPKGRVTLEPKIMKVLLAFADAERPVVSREDLLHECWDGRIVGEDAVNRTIAELRRAARQAGAGFTIETIPRIGYRLNRGTQPAAASAGPHRTLATRRVAGAAMLAVLSGVGGVAIWRSGFGTAAQPLIDQGRRALYNGFPDSGTVAAGVLEQALQREPRNAEAWGLLAFAYREIAEAAAPADVSRAVQASEHAARRALELQPDEGNARAALATLQPYFGEFAAGEDRLMTVLAVDPDNALAITHLVALLQGVGRVRRSAEWNERLARLDPLSPVALYRRANKLWAMGQLDAADLAIDRAMHMWPRHPGVWNVRMMMLAFTGRAVAGLALLNDDGSRPPTLKKPGLDLWRISLRALHSRAPTDIAAARLANIAAAPRSPGFANIAMPTLSMLGELDAAFDVAYGYFLRRGPLIATLWEGAGELPISALRWRRTMALFGPPAAPMRADPRFDALMEGMGIAQYWRQRGVRPDYQLSQA